MRGVEPRNGGWSLGMRGVEPRNGWVESRDETGWILGMHIISGWSLVITVGGAYKLIRMFLGLKCPDFLCSLIIILSMVDISFNELT